jgi:PAS domain S-box-containing protein
MSLHEKSSPNGFPKLLGMPFVPGVTLIYLLIGCLWIYSSDLLALWLTETEEQLRVVSTYKGWFFIFFTAALLFLVLHRFVAKIRKTQQQLRESEDRFEIATSVAHIGVWDRDIVNNRLIWDEQMTQIYGIRSKESDGAYEAWKQCVHPDDRSRAEQAVKEAECGEKDFDTEFRIVRPDGAVRNIRAFGKVFRDKAGRPVRMIGVNYDITESRQIEETLRTRNEELERFNRAATERELRMIELKNEINRLHRQLGQTVPYVVADVAKDASIPATGLKPLLKKLFGKNKPHAT